MKIVIRRLYDNPLLKEDPDENYITILPMSKLNKNYYAQILRNQ